MRVPDIILSIKRQYPSFSPSLKKIADYLFANIQEAVYLNINQLAEKSAVSIATITRFVQTLGFSNYKVFQIELMKGISSEKTASNGKKHSKYDFAYGICLDKKESVNVICGKVFQSNMQMISENLQILDFSLVKKVAELIIAARNILFIGVGRSKLVTESGRMRFYRLGFNSFSYSDPHEQIIACSNCTKNDLVFGVSNYGHSASVVHALQEAKKQGATTVCITSIPDSPIATVSDYAFITTNNNHDLEFSPNEYSYEPASENITQAVLMDSIYMTVVSRLDTSYIEKIRESTKATNTERI